MNSHLHDTAAVGRVSGGSVLSSAQIQTPHFDLGGEKFASIQHMLRAVSFPPGSSERFVLALNDPHGGAVSPSLKGGTQLFYWNGKQFTNKDPEFTGLIKAAQAAVRRARGIEEDPRHTNANVVSSSRQYGLCSNFACTPFVFGGIAFASSEAFIHYIKFAPTDARREVFPSLSGAAARAAAREIGTEIQQALIGGSSVFIYWGDDRILYRSDAHFRLIKQALTEKFRSSSEARMQLIATGDRNIVHDTGRPESRYTSLPSKVFCEILTRIRGLVNSGELR
jgi:predicted NAD-dependent protein-ADP-ribosyltransferase YbiA (DUF1768 family)